MIVFDVADFDLEVSKRVVRSGSASRFDLVWNILQKQVRVYHLLSLLQEIRQLHMTLMGCRAKSCLQLGLNCKRFYLINLLYLKSSREHKFKI